MAALGTPLLHLQADGARFAEIDGLIFHNRSRERNAFVLIDGQGQRGPKRGGRQGRGRGQGRGSGAGYYYSPSTSQSSHHAAGSPRLSIRTMMGNLRDRTADEEQALLREHHAEDTMHGGESKTAFREQQQQPPPPPHNNNNNNNSNNNNGCTVFRCQLIGTYLHIKGGARPTVAKCTVTAPLACAVRVSGLASDADIRFNNISWVRLYVRCTKPRHAVGIVVLGDAYSYLYCANGYVCETTPVCVSIPPHVLCLILLLLSRQSESGGEWAGWHQWNRGGRPSLPADLSQHRAQFSAVRRVGRQRCQRHGVRERVRQLGGLGRCSDRPWHRGQCDNEPHSEVRCTTHRRAPWGEGGGVHKSRSQGGCGNRWEPQRRRRQ